MIELSRREFLGRTGVLYGAAAAGPVLWKQPAASAGRPRAPRIGWGGDPRRAVTVSWATTTPVRRPVVDFGLDNGFGRSLPAETRTVPGWSVHYHRVTVDGLEPGEAYRYRIRHHGAAGPARTVRTAPAAAGTFTFAAYGDQGTTAGAERILGVLASAAPAFTFCLGDLCYADPSGGVAPAGRVDHRAWDQWLRMVSHATASTAAVLPVVGNHEIETGMGPWGYDGFLTRIALPANGLPGLPTTWSARWGNVALVAADGNDASTEITRNNGLSGGAQDRWLEATLSLLRSDPDVDWIVVGFHHCAYCTNTLHGSGGSWGSAGGVTYLCAGGGGGQTFPMSVAPLSTVTVEGGARIPERAPWSAFRYNDHSLLLVDVDVPGTASTTTLTVRALSATGAEFDRVTLLRRRKARDAAAPEAAELPAGAPAA